MAYKDFSAANGIFRVIYTETTNLTANTSTITVTKCQFASTNWYGTNFYGDGIVQINGTTVVTLTNDVYHATDYIAATNEFHDIAGSAGSQSVTVSHNADGSGTASITLKGRPGVYNDMNMFCLASTNGNYAYNGSLNITLTKINRSFTLTINAGSNTSVEVTRLESPISGEWGPLNSGATIYYGDVLEVTYSVGTGCTISTHTINGSSFNSGATHTVTAAVTVRTTATVNSFTLSLSIGSNSSITVNRTSSPKQGAAQGYLNNGSTIYYGDVLSISYSVSTGYKIGTHTLNGTTFTSGVSHTVTAAVSVVTTATVRTFTLTRTVGAGMTLVVRRTASPNGGGSTGILTSNTVYYGDVLELTASANAGYNIELMSVNGVAYTDNPHTHTVVGAVTIVLESKALGFVYIDSGASIEKYKIVIDSGSAMDQYRAMIDTGSAIVPY